MPQYNDIYVRDNFGDSGMVPSSGNPCQSPDIIPYGTGTLTPQQLTNTAGYATDYGKAVVSATPNNVYVRAKNLSSAASSGTASLYYSKASLLLLPSRWVAVQTASGAGNVALVDVNLSPSIAPQAMCFTNPPFALQGPPPASNDHYCMIALVNTPAHPVVVPTTFPSNAAFASWVQNNAAVGWRNISVISSSVNNFTRTLNFGSEDSGPAQFYFRVVGQNFIPGTAVSAQCTDARCPISQALSLPQPNAQGQQIVGFEAPIPGLFSGNMTLNATSSSTFSPNADLQLQYYKIPLPNDDFEATVSRTVLIRSPSAALTDVDALVEAQLIPLGTYTVKVVG